MLRAAHSRSTLPEAKNQASAFSCGVQTEQLVFQFFPQRYSLFWQWPPEKPLRQTHSYSSSCGLQRPPLWHGSWAQGWPWNVATLLERRTFSSLRMGVPIRVIWGRAERQDGDEVHSWRSPESCHTFSFLIKLMLAVNHTHFHMFQLPSSDTSTCSEGGSGALVTSQRAHFVFWPHKFTLVQRIKSNIDFFSSTREVHRQDRDRYF